MFTSLSLIPLNQMLLFIYVVINFLAFVIIFIDKIKSKKKVIKRISEGKLFFLATAFGALGVYVGMFTFHHKTRKWYFFIGIPLLIIQNISLFYCLYLLY